MSSTTEEGCVNTSIRKRGRPAKLTKEERAARRKIRSLRWKSANKDRVLERQRGWYQRRKAKNPNCSRDQNRSWSLRKFDASFPDWRIAVLLTGLPPGKVKNRATRWRGRFTDAVSFAEAHFAELERQKQKCRDREKIRCADDAKKAAKVAGQKAWAQRNKARINARGKELRSTPEGRAVYRAKVKARRSTPEGKLIHNLRNRCYAVFGRVGHQKPEKTMDLLGCSAAHARAWIERQFTRGMTWANYGEWHVDHRAPIAGFDLTNELQRRAAFHFTNLQPLWAAENIAKSDRILAPVQISLPIAA